MFPPVHICASNTRIYAPIVNIAASDTVSSAPRQFSLPSDAKIGPGDFPEGNLFELALPWAMKISRVPGVR